jgi:hypothetical protein
MSAAAKVADAGLDAMHVVWRTSQECEQPDESDATCMDKHMLPAIGRHTQVPGTQVLQTR